jgi:tRNA G18 (ribose-2'-O)-methylase SpoU
LYHAQNITAFELPGLAPYRTLRRQFDQREQGLFVAEGEKVVRRLLESRWEVVSVLLPENWLLALEPLLQARPEDLPVFVAKKKLLETLTGFSMYQGLLAVGRVPPPLSLEAMLARGPRPRLLAAVDGLSSAENLGGLVRNCAAFGVQALLVGETSASPFLRRAVRSSMGAIFHLPVLETPSLAGTLAQLRAHDVRCIAAHPRAEQRLVSQTDLSGDSCLVFGSEGYGLSPAVLAACQEAAAIPTSASVDSLNVSCAAAVFLYEANRQRTDSPQSTVHSPQSNGGSA